MGNEAGRDPAVKGLGPDLSHDYKPSELVPVRRSGGAIEFISAARLHDYKVEQQFGLYAGRTLSIGTDLALLFEGGTEVKLAAEALAKKELSNVAKTALKKELAKGFAHATLGATGFANSAAGHQNPITNTILNARNAAFVLDGLGGGRLDKLLCKSGKEAAPIMEAIAKESPWVSKVQTGTRWAFKAGEKGFIVQGTNEALREIRDAIDPSKKQAAARFYQEFGDARGVEKATAQEFDRKNSGSLANTEGMLNNYAELLSDGKSPQVKAQIEQVFAKANALYKNGPSDPAVMRYRQELLQDLSISGGTLMNVEKSRMHVRLTESEVHELHNTKNPHALEHIRNIDDDSALSLARFSGKSYYDTMFKQKEEQGYAALIQDCARNTLKSEDQELRASKAIAALYLSRDKSGNLPEIIGTVPIAIPADRTTYGEYPAHALNLRWSAQDVIGSLKDSVVDSKSAGGKLAGSDVLLRLGAITDKQFGGILVDTLSNHSNSKLARMNALCDPSGRRFATIMDELAGMEYVTGRGGKAEDLAISSEDMRNALKRAAKTDPDSDVRALSQAIAFSGNTKFVSALNDLWQAVKESPNSSFTKELSSQLNRMMTNSDPRIAVTGALVAKAAAGNENPSLRLQALKVYANNMKRCDQDFQEKLLDNLDATDKHLLAGADRAALQQLTEQSKKLLEKSGKEPAGITVWQQAKSLADLSTPAERSKFNAVERRILPAAPVQLKLAVLHDLAQNHDVASAQAIRAEARSSNPQVQVAALSALETLKDPQLPALVKQLSRHAGNEPSLAKKLENLSFEQEKSSQPISQTTKQALSEARMAKVTEIAPTKSAPAETTDWLVHKYPLLVKSQYDQAVAKAKADGNLFVWALGQQDSIRENNVSLLRAERQLQWEDLTKEARGVLGRPNDNQKFEPAQAQKALFEIMKNPNLVDDEQCQRFAAIQLANACKFSAVDRSTARNLVETALTSLPNMSDAAFLHLVDGWQQLVRPVATGSMSTQLTPSQLSERRYVDTVTTALLQQVKLRNYVKQAALIKALQSCPYGSAIPVLETLSKDSENQEIRKQASRCLQISGHVPAIRAAATPGR